MYTHRRKTFEMSPGLVMQAISLRGQHIYNRRKTRILPLERTQETYLHSIQGAEMTVRVLIMMGLLKLRLESVLRTSVSKITGRETTGE